MGHLCWADFYAILPSEKADLLSNLYVESKKQNKTKQKKPTTNEYKKNTQNS